MTELTASVPDLLARIPEVIGFEPRESVVVVGLTSRGEVTVALRIDRVACRPGTEVGEIVARHLVATLAVRALLVTFTEDDVRLACPAVDALRPAVARACESAEAWAVVRGRFFSPGCFDPACCPEAGTPLPRRTGPGSLGRDTRAAVLRAADSWWSERAAAPRPWRTASARRWDRAMRAAEGGLPRPGAVASGRLTASLGDVHVRDYVLIRTIGGTSRARREALAGGPSDAVAAALDAVLQPRASRVPDNRVARLDALFGDLLATAEDERRAPLATLRCLIAWWRDEGSRAVLACRDALEADPTYRLAALLDAALEHDIPPGWCRAEA